MHIVLKVGRPPTTAAGSRIPLPLEGACAFVDGRALMVLVALEAPDSAEREAVEQGRARVRGARTASHLVLAVGLTADVPAEFVCRLPACAAEDLHALAAQTTAAPPRLVVALCDTESGLVVALHPSALPATVAHAVQAPDEPESVRLRRTG